MYTYVDINTQDTCAPHTTPHTHNTHHTHTTHTTHKMETSKHQLRDSIFYIP
jgi:hypothetical protein